MSAPFSVGSATLLFVVVAGTLSFYRLSVLIIPPMPSVLPCLPVASNPSTLQQTLTPLISPIRGPGAAHFPVPVEAPSTIFSDEFALLQWQGVYVAPQ